MTDIKGPLIPGSDIPGKIYDDAASPAVKQVGKFIERLPRAANAILSSVDQWIVGREESVMDVSRRADEKLKNVPSEKIVSPEPSTLASIYQSTAYSSSADEIRDMFANLLASSMNIDDKDNIHPSFANIVQSLSPHDAKFLSYLKSENNTMPICEFRLQKPLRPQLNDIENYDKHFENHIFSKVPGTGRTIIKYMSTFSYDFSKTEISIINLIRLGLLNDNHGLYFVDLQNYKSFTEPAFLNILLDGFSNLMENGFEFALIPGIIDSTYFGKQFIDICVS